ncbi:PREDICTED: pikachurin-like [Ceratosolen solmsi marchali]|uniref:Pikachurin-like n=1 Tax=Ceratosolen solmsi marchali TaxID=326594 RepID=A0AAJ6VMJ6_9HYME|nr:PREDICTED: pikachurin-like [Ceratosolen solmsi marchali]
MNDVTFRGDGWLELSNSIMTHKDEKEMIGFEVSTNKTNGLIMWHGNKFIKRITNNYIALAIIDGYIECQYNLGSGPVILRITTIKIDDGQRHRIIVKRDGRNGSIELDGEHIEIGISDGHNEQLEISENVFIGGVPDPLITLEKFYVGFSGCIYTLEVQDSGAINIGKNAIRGKNVSPCTRARWIPSSLVFTDAEENMFDAFVPPPPVNIIHPKPTVNKASIFFIGDTESNALVD